MSSIFGNTGATPPSLLFPNVYGKRPTSGATQSTTPTKPATLSSPVRQSDKNVPNYRGFIQVCVGTGAQQQTFDVHESLIIGRSAFFRKALSGAWKGKKDRLVNLPDDNPATFNRYVHLLYTNELAIVPGVFTASITGSNQEQEESVRLAELYVLAEKPQDFDTKNTAIEAMLLLAREHNGNHFSWRSAILIVYNGTTPSSLMRKLLVDIYVYRAKSWWLMIPHLWPAEFVSELATQLLDKRGLPEDYTMVGDASIYLETKVKKLP